MWSLALLTGDGINGFFFVRKCMAVLPSQKSARNNYVTLYRSGRKTGFHCKIESFRFWDENDYEYEMFSIVSSARAWGSVILAGKLGSRRQSTRSFSGSVVVAGTSYQMLEVLALAIGRGLNLLQ